MTARTPADTGYSGEVSGRVNLYRYFFYAWLFRDAHMGTSLERSEALRHNSVQAKWLPIYLFRWAVGGVVIQGLEVLAELRWGDSWLPASLAVLLVFVVLFLIVTSICWEFLRIGRQSK